uniref:ATP synthase subunit a n=1 Tax=Styela clava TaxID=7725 RepID=A0A024HVY9_STYCL|nr:ATP synthase F0 subunit 6 [Styela clava]CDM98930.1 ATPase subunit 6 [Styela clava]
MLFLNFESSLFFFTPVGLLLVWMMVLMSSKYITSFNNKFQLSEIVGHFSSGKYYPGLLFMMGMFFLILLFNLYGLVPGMFPLSSLPFLTMGMAVILWSGGYVYCLSKNLLGCVSHMLPLGSPMVLSVFLVWVEVLSWLCRPIALGVRLMANITAGHLLLSLVGGGVFFSGVWFLLPFGFLLALMLMEIGVAMIQSYVYNLLLSLYMDEGL